MGNLYRMMLAWPLCAACSASPQVGSTSAAVEPPPRARAALREERDPRLDEQGHLQPSELKLSWFAIPLGFTRMPGSDDRMGTFEADGLTLDQVREYVLAHARPKRITPRSTGEFYENARPAHTELPLPPVQITAIEIEPHRHRFRLSVEDLAPTGPVVSVPEAESTLRQARTTQE
jgi:hypothetical protein